MNKIALSGILLLFLLTSFLVTKGQKFPQQPNPPRIVVDYADVLTGQEEDVLERKLVKYNDTTSTQIAVVTINSTDGYAISQYSFELGERWGIGQKGLDNGILILVAKADRDVFIATGYGVEDVVPDAIAKRIVENTIVPNFRKGRFYEGLDQATDILIDLTTGRYSADELSNEDEEIPFALIVFSFIIALFLFTLAASILSKGGKQYHYSDRGSRTYPSDFGRPSTGWWSSSGSSGSSGGGFGGFGGGSFGGGGAGGSW